MELELAKSEYARRVMVTLAEESVQSAMGNKQASRKMNKPEDKKDDKPKSPTADGKPKKPEEKTPAPEADHSDSDSDSDDEIGEKKAAPTKVLAEPTIGEVAGGIKSGKFKNVIVMTGAGISTSAGIPDFRSPGTGLYHNLQKYNLPNPEAIFHIDYLKENPNAFFTLAKELFPGHFKATPCHYFIRLLNEKGVLLRNFTQNIDTLELIAQIPEDKCVFAHGSFAGAHCISCHEVHDVEWVKQEILASNVPRCKSCKGIVKPDIVFFGENLPERFFQLMVADFAKCDLLIVIGTSLKVHPFASLITRVNESVPRVLINMDKVGQVSSELLSRGIDTGGFNFTPSGYRDVFMQGDCDTQCKALAELLGWKDDLNKLIEEGAKAFKPIAGAAPTATAPAATEAADKPAAL